MDCERRFIARAINPVKKDPPASCRKDKTINMDSFKTKLFLFKDTRPEAQEYAKEILPTLLDTTTKPEDLLKLYNSLEYDWLEFDFQTNILYLCSLKKSQP